MESSDVWTKVQRSKAVIPHRGGLKLDRSPGRLSHHRSLNEKTGFSTEDLERLSPSIEPDGTGRLPGFPSCRTSRFRAALNGNTAKDATLYVIPPFDTYRVGSMRWRMSGMVQARRLAEWHNREWELGRRGRLSCAHLRFVKLGVLFTLEYVD